jgi:Uma2 family endonuclease
MNVVLQKPMTLAEFIDWEERQPLRYEFDGFRPIAMTGGTAAHAALQRNLAISLGGRLRGKPCQFFGSDLKIEVTGRIRYPDGFVVCSPTAPTDKIVRDPVVIFEVLSDSTARTDLITRNHEYAATPSVKRYVILSQEAVAGTVFERVDADWVGICWPPTRSCACRKLASSFRWPNSTKGLSWRRKARKPWQIHLPAVDTGY